MKTPFYGRYAIAALSLAGAACLCTGLGQTSTPLEIEGTVEPITLGDDLTQIDVCGAIPAGVIEGAVDRRLAADPQPFEYYDTPGTNGCWYDFGKDSDGEAHFGYVVFTPPAVYDEQPLYMNEAVSGLGDEAYFNNGADARQLWVRLRDRVAFVVAFGDVPQEDAARTIAEMLLDAIQ